MSRHSDHNVLIQRARKAGLSTRELYTALTAREGEVGEPQPTQTDCNGFVVGFSANGHRVFEPLGSRPRS